MVEKSMNKLFEKTKIIGFIECDNYEYVMYLSRISINLGLKTLIIDDHDSTFQIHFKNLNYPSLRLIEQRSVIIADKRFLSEINDDEYDLIFLNYSNTILSDKEYEELKLCNNVYISTDLQNINKDFLKIFFTEISDTVKISLIIKDIVNCKIKIKYILNELGVSQKDFQSIYEIYHDSLDYTQKINCQYSSLFTFRRLSYPLKSMLRDIFINLGHNSKSVKKAYNRASKGV